MVRKTYVNAGKLANMCRICLTQSNNMMYSLKDEMALEDSNKIQVSILEALEKVVAVKIFMNEEFPQYICPMCVSILKMSFKFVCQFEESQNKLWEQFNKAPTCDISQSKTHVPKEEDTTEDATSNEENNPSAPVEIIYLENKFDLKDVIVVEEKKEDKCNFNGFLNNLGEEISATFVGKSKIKPNIKDPGVDAVSVYIKDNQNSVVPVKELKFDNNTNSIDYVLEDMKFEILGDEPNNDKFEIIEENASDNNYEVFYIETVSSSDETDINKENLKMEMSNMQDVIESLIIETPENDMGPKKPRKHKNKIIEEKQVDDLIIMGPASHAPQLVRENEDDLFEREVRYPCEVCKKTFATDKALRAHKRRSHFPSQRQFTCEICGHKNKTRSGYVHHKNKHLGKKFTCEVCNKTYYTRAVLKVHMETHVNKRQHLCNVCGKGFNYANALVYHMRLHTGEKSYKCEYCEETFRMPNSLKRHLCTHTGERPYKCRFCSRAFCSRSEVSCHEHIHTGYRPYHCKHCMKGFTKTHNLKIHLLSHTGPHGCEICGKSFIEMSILSMHYKTAHKELLEKEDEMTE